ncbi:MAG: hypothetical protein R2690_20605 [Acidimicrobiales bacterium]
MGIPYEPVGWARDRFGADHEDAFVVKQTQVDRLINMHRVRGHLIADLDPLAAEEPHLYSELDPATYGLTIWDPRPRVPLSHGVNNTDTMRLRDLLKVVRDAYCRTVGIEYMHIQDPEEKRWIQQHVEGRDDDAGPRRATPHPRRRRRGARAVLEHQVPGPARSGSASRAWRAPSRCSMRC